MKHAPPFFVFLLISNFFGVIVLQNIQESDIPPTLGTSTQNGTSPAVTSPSSASSQTTVQDALNQANGSASTTTATTTTSASTSHVTEMQTVTRSNDSSDVTATQSSTATQTNSPLTTSISTTFTPIPTESSQLTNDDNSTEVQTGPTIPTTSVSETSETTNSHTSSVLFPKLDRSWMEFFVRVHHFDGLYEYEGGRYSFDFVVSYVHPMDVYTLVAKFYDQDGAIIEMNENLSYVHPLDAYTLVAKFYDQDGAMIEMNGTSTDGIHIIFKQCTTFSADFRFTALSGIVLDGKLVSSEGLTYYTGNFTRPLNSSFTWFHMNKGLGAIVTGDAASTRRAIIIVIPASLAFLAVIGTTAILCWASKKGLFGRRHKSYLLFKDNQVSYESEAETIHI